jgi:hypothetical protein
MKLAFCVSGQLARFEIVSKIKNVFVANTLIGHHVDVFILLDPDVKEVKQTFWRFDYSTNPYNDMTSDELKKHVEELINKNLVQVGLKPEGQITVRSRFEEPAQRNFSVRNNKYPVTDKTGPDHEAVTKLGYEPAAIRWQNNMRWLAGVRECVRWIQKTELEQRWFYDVVIRFRDDSYAFGPWLLNEEMYKGGFVSTIFGVHFGVNDHNFAIDRYWADQLFRGVTEDYYFNETLDIYSWGNPERRIYKVATTNKIRLLNTTLCEQPIVPLRGRHNETHWRLHPTYSYNMAVACLDVIGDAHTKRFSLQSSASDDEVSHTKMMTVQVDDDKTESSWSIFNIFNSFFNSKSKKSKVDHRKLRFNSPPKLTSDQIKEIALKRVYRRNIPKDECCDEEWFDMLDSQVAPINMI